MRTRQLSLAGLATLLVILPAQAQDALLPTNPVQPGRRLFVPPGDPEPILQVDAHGPRGAVQGLAFGPQGDTLYAGGYDKVVRVWSLAKDGRFELSNTSYRVPIGPGLGGAIAALALSPDGRWLAVSGHGVMSESSGFRSKGMVLPGRSRLSETMLLDQGTIYLFDTTTTRFVRALRGHKGVVLTMTFAPDGGPNKQPILVSAAREMEQGKHLGRVRTWDVNAGTQQAESPALPDPFNDKVGASPPGVTALWTPGKKLFVGLGWQDGKARLWDVAANRFDSTADGELNSAVAFLPDGTLFTGSHRAGKAILQAWRHDADKGQLLDDGKRAIRLDEESAPRTMALLKSKTGPLDRAALILRYPGAELARDTYRLHLVNLAPGLEAGKILQTVDLWSAGFLRQVAAASPDGRFLAVAGNPRHEIHLYRVADLGAGPQVLHGSGQNFAKVFFVRKGKNLGLRLEDTRGRKQVLDLTGRELTGELEEWKRDGPDPQGWQVNYLVKDEKGRSGFRILHQGREQGTIRLGVNQVPTGVGALLPPAPEEGPTVPLLAVALEEYGGTYLHLYDVASGQQVRQLTWHLSPIRSLAFSSDGRFLVSTADDQTVAVWSLKDMLEGLGRRGLLRGVQVEMRKDQLCVGRLDKAELSDANQTAFEAANVKAGMAIAGLVKAGKLQPLASPKDFFETIWGQRPGSPVILRIGERDVTLTVDQAIDERKPLFSLFFMDAAQIKDRHWIGWSPQGPYDTSDPEKTEPLLVWHRNTGKAEAPTSVAPARQYRDEYYKPKILPQLILHGDLEGALGALKPPLAPRPETSLTLEGFDPAVAPKDRQGNPVLQDQPPRLTATVHGLEPALLDSVTWKWDDGETRTFEGDFKTRYTADIPPEFWKRGLHSVRLIIKTRDAKNTQFDEVLRVRYVPRPPVIQVTTQPDGPVKTKQFVLEGTVKPGEGAAAEPLQVSLLLPDGKTLPVALKEQRFRQEITLKPDANRVEIRAGNKNAEPETIQFETAESKVVQVIFEPTRPVVTLETIKSGDKTLPAEGKVIVNTPKVVIHGRITSTDKVVEAKCGEIKLAVGNGPPQAAVLRFAHEVELRPGKEGVELKFTALTENAKTGESAVKIAYHPLLPTFTLNQPEDGRERGPRELELELEGRLSSVLAPLPTAKVRINNEEPIPAGIDPKTGRVTARIKLLPGENVVSVRLDNGFGEKTLTYTVYCKRPPVVTRVSHSKVGEKPQVEVSAQVETPADLDLQEARLVRYWQEKGKEKKDVQTLTRKHLTRGEKTATGQAWSVTVPDVPLAEGATRVEIFARNRDGESLESKEATIRWSKPVPPIARVTLTEPAADQNTASPHSPCVFRVRSTSKLSRVEVRVGGKPVLSMDQLQRTEKDGEVLFEVPGRGIALQAGTNPIQVVVYNEGGPAYSSAVTVSYTRPPVAVFLDDLQDLEEGKVIEPSRYVNGQPVFTQPLPTGRLLVRGRVEWADNTDPGLHARRVQVRPTVNDFEQFAADLEEPVGLVRKFKALVRLNRKDNDVVLHFPQLKLELSSAARLTLSCLKPEEDQRLHLVVISPGYPNQDELRQEVLKAFQADNIQGDTFSTGAFKEARIIMLPPESNRGRVSGALVRINQEIQIRPKKLTQAMLNDVVVVYFRGKVVLESSAHYLLTEDSEKRGNYPKTAINANTLRDQLADFLGAKLLLLDVNHEKGEQPASSGRVAEWAQESSGVGVLRYVSLAKDEKTPGQKRLIKAIEDSLVAHAGLLWQVRDQAGARAQQLQKTSPGLFFNWYTPVGLERMRLGEGGQ